MSEGRGRRTRRHEAQHEQTEAQEQIGGEQQNPAVIATNSTVKLTCTLAAMMSLFALFLCFAEKKSLAIRHYAVQSVALTALNLIVGAALLVIGSVLGVIPVLGFLITLVCWLVYIAVAIACVATRVRMMYWAWQGLRFTLPLVGDSLGQYC